MSRHWPEKIEGRIATKNKMGFMFEISGVSSQFIKDCKNYQGTVVDIGCAYGIVTLPALENSNANVIAIDLSSEHLKILRKSVPANKIYRLKTVAGRFPNDITFNDNSIDAIHSSLVFHFLNGADTKKALNKIYAALKPGGKFYVNTMSVYIVVLKQFLLEYEKNVKNGAKYPGEIFDFENYAPEQDVPHTPDFFNVYKQKDFEKVLQTAGFHVDESFYYDVKEPAFLASGGKGVIAAIVSKPA